MSEPATLLQLAGADTSPGKIRDAALIFIDLQNEYLDGPVAVQGADNAILQAQQLLEPVRLR